MAKKKTTEKALNIDNILFNCRDYLRAARNSGSFFEKRDMMLTLVFLRFIGEKYEDGIENLKQTLKEQGLDPEDENIRAAFFDEIAGLMLLLQMVHITYHQKQDGRLLSVHRHHSLMLHLIQLCKGLRKKIHS